MEATAKLRLARISARKARLIADLIRGRDVEEALEILKFTRKKSALMFKNLVESAVANAEHSAQQQDEKLDIDQLYVKAVFVDSGPALRRWRPRAHGRATKILKQTAHLTVVVDDAAGEA